MSNNKPEELKVSLQDMSVKISKLFIEADYSMTAGMAVLAMTLAEAAYHEGLSDEELIAGFIKTVKRVWSYEERNNVTEH